MIGPTVRFSPKYNHLIVEGNDQLFSIPWSQRDRLAQWLHVIAINRPLASAEADAALPASLVAGMVATNEILYPPKPIARATTKITSVAELLGELDL